MPLDSPTSHFAGFGRWRRLLWFLLFVGLASAAGVVIGYFVSGRAGVYCALLAAAVCVAAGGASLVVRLVVVSPQLALLHVLVGFFLRMGAPLAVCMVVYWRGGPLVEAGFVFYLLGLYLIALAVGTSLGPWPGGYSRPKSVR